MEELCKDCNVSTEDGAPSVFIAVENNHPKCLEVLIKTGADVNKKYNQGTPLICATQNGFDDCISLLIEAGADVNSKNLYGFPLIIVAAQHGRYDCLKLLIEAGADVNTIVSQLATPLHALMENLDNVESKLLLKNIKLLLRAGANVNVFRNMTALYFNKYEHNALRHYIIQCPTFSVQPDKKVCMLLYAAGETIDGCTIRRTSDAGQNERAHVPQILFQKKLKMNLKHICRNAIRSHLISLEPQTHLFHRIPQLGLPPSLTEYLLYNLSLDDDSDDNDDSDGDGDDDYCHNDDCDYDDDDDDDYCYYYDDDCDDDNSGDDLHCIDYDDDDDDDDDDDNCDDHDSGDDQRSIDDDSDSDDVIEVLKKLQVSRLFDKLS